MGAAQEYHVDLDAPRRVVFISSTTLDEFEGVTEAIDGFVLLDGQGLRETTAPGETELYFEVDLASLDTGIGLRNRHMRENYLEVEDHPFATFSGSLQGMTAHGAGFRVTARGAFSVHGVSRSTTISCDVTPREDRYAVACTFPVRLEDHDIEIPRIMFMKLAPEVRLELEFFLEPAGS
jgi:polyisoprenoid-binding protein YceI